MNYYKSLLLGFLCSVLSVPLLAQTTLISYGSSWSFYDNQNEPPNQGSLDWNDASYNDTAWSSGNAQLGYGDGDETTVTNSNAYTTYFRHSFTIADPNAYADLNLDLTYDDGAIVYLNGSEVWRVNMPFGTVTYNTFTPTQGSDNAQISTSVSNVLVTGTNVLAVEIHQRSAGSSDISFDFQLVADDSTGPPAGDLIAAGSTWKYLDDGSNQGTAWRGTGFDDSAWSSGPAELGYGDGGEATVVSFGPDANNKYRTTYFRHTLTVADASVIGNLDLEAIRDDGMVVYLNGIEVWRDHMPTGTIDYLTFANSPAIGGSDESTWITNTIANSLVTGTNVVAVEIHQVNATSSDLSFNFKMSDSGGNPPSSDELISDTDTWNYLDNGSDQGTSWYGIGFDDSSWSSGAAELGYGDGGEATVLSFGPDSNNKYVTTYFRKTFNVTDHTLFDFLSMEAIRDDGMVVYLNGIEVWRDHITGTVDYQTLADSPAIGGTDETTWISQAVANTLVTGNNILAVEIHQQALNSSDISFNFRLSGATAGAVNVERGPYLQKGSPSSVVVRWRTDTPTQSIVNYGTSLGNLTLNASDLTPKTEHELEISGLSAETKYYYDIANSSSVIIPESSDQFFKTHPVVGTTQPYTFWILGDAGTANNDQRAVRDAYYGYIGSNDTDGILFLGDNAYNDGTDSEYQNAIFENMYEDKLKNSIAWSTLGNHDGHSADSNSQTGPYYDIFTFPTAGESGGLASGTEAYYSFDYGNIHFIVLESYETDRSVGGTMYNWALNDIQNTTQEWIVAVWHHPPYTKGSHNSDTETELVDMRQNFLPMLETNGVDLVLSGHSHSYERSYLLNGHYGTSGTFNSVTHTVGATGDGDGQTDGSGSYTKTTTGPDGGKGAVYITAGSSGKISGGSLNHNAMYASLNLLGSCILEVDGNTLHVKFIRETGAISDYFTIEKGCSTVGNSCDDGDACTDNDVFDEDCNCVGTPVADSDGDGVCDTEDVCPGSDDTIDSDSDGMPDGCDTCPLSATGDTDGDGVCDDLDICPGSDDTIDTDSDGTPDGCDSCPLSASGDSDGDGVCDDADVCPGFDDMIDSDSDSIPDGCDSCPLSATGDSDGDGVCDNDDVCPGFDDTVDTDSDGTPDGCDTCPLSATGDSDGDGVCDDSDVCPGSDDTIDTDSDGVPDGCDDCPLSATGDSDGDGVCDNNDICPGFDDTIDSDSDGIPDGCDACPLSATGDSDGDGVCDNDDQCPGQDDALIGTSCDDGDDCTINDVYDANCGCSGTAVADSDGDGVCDDNDICPGFDDTIDTDSDGTPDGCDTCPLSATGDSDGDGVCDDADVCPGSDDTIDSDGDGNPDGCDICPGSDDTVDTDSDGTPDGCDACPLSATGDSDGDSVCDDADVCPGSDDTIDSDDDGTPDGCDICPGSDDNVDTDSDGTPDGCDVCPLSATGDSDGDGVCDDADICSGSDDTIDTDSDSIPDGCDACPLSATGDSDGDGVCDDADICPGSDDTIDTDSDGKPDGCDTCPLSATGDSDGDGVCDNDDICPGFDDSIDTDGDGSPDGCDACPLSATGDSDGDGVCDNEDQCPGQDDALIGTSCDDGDACTENDVYDANCGCVGTQVPDSDGDGVCDTEDQCPGFDDSIDVNGNGIPDDCEVGCSNYTIDFNDFDSTWGIWNDGGSDCRRSSNDAIYSNGGTGSSVRLRDDTSTSTMTTDDLDLSVYEELTIDFNYYARSMDNSNEDFWLQISTNGGASFTTVEEWNRDDEFVNDNRYFDQVVISGPFTSNTQLRFRCDASGNSDWVYIDDVQITGCTSSSPPPVAESGEDLTDTDNNDPIEIRTIKIFPNPVSQILYIDLSQYEGLNTNVRLLNLSGQLIISKAFNGDYSDYKQLNLDKVSDGLYILFIEDSLGNILTRKQLVIKNE